MSSFRLKKSSGFSLIEVLVSVGLLGMIAISLSFINSANEDRKKREIYQNNLDTVLSYFRQARTDAISNRVIGSETPEGGFGVHLEKSENTLIITYFADTEDSVGGGEGDGEYTNGAYTDEILDEETITRIWDIDFEGHSPAGTYSNDEFTVIFLPPNAEMTINDNDNTNDLRSAEILASYKETEKRICLNRISRFFEVLTQETCP